MEVMINLLLKKILSFSLKYLKGVKKNSDILFIKTKPPFICLLLPYSQQFLLKYLGSLTPNLKAINHDFFQCSSTCF